MICKKCETILSEDAKFCPVCGTAVNEEPQVAVQPEPVVQPEPQPEPVVQPVPQPEPVVQPVPQPTVAPAPAPVQPQEKKKFTEEDIPSQYQLMGPWSYFWLNFLFSVPLVGFIFLIIFSFSKGNLNRRNYARSFWCAWLVVAVIAVIFFLIVFIIALLSGISMGEIASGAAESTIMY